MAHTAPSPLPLVRPAPRLLARLRGPGGAAALLLGAGALTVLVYPPIWDGRPQLLLGELIWSACTGLLAWGYGRGRWPAQAAGMGGLAALIVAGMLGPPTPLTAAPGLVWGERGALLLALAAGWLWLMRPPRWLGWGGLGIGLPTLGALALLALTAPPTARHAAIYWLAVDGAGRVYASDVDGGELWRLDNSGAVQGRLWPRLAPPLGTPGPGYLPVGSEWGLFGGAGPAGQRPTATGPGVNEFAFCGLALDPDDHLYLADIELRRVLRFDSAGHLQAAWPLPATYHPARGCLAADAGRVYVADADQGILVYSPTGSLLAQWTRPTPPLGLSVAPDGRLAVLQRTSVALLDPAAGAEVVSWPLPAITGQLATPYQAILARRDGTLLVTDVTAARVLHYSSTGAALPSLGARGTASGQFLGLAALAEDCAGNLYISDFDTHVVQRFRPDGPLPAAWSIPIYAGDAEDD